jgi:hypothetical protein
MEKINDLIFEIKKLSDEFVVEATNNANGNKAAGRRARKISQTLTKMFKDYRSLTIEAEKAPQE